MAVTDIYVVGEFNDWDETAVSLTYHKAVALADPNDSRHQVYAQVADKVTRREYG
jgi:hypothetical protein